MHRITLAPRTRRTMTLACGLALVLAAAASVKGAERMVPCKDQSPRRLEKYDAVSKTASVAKGAGDTIVYTPKGGTPTRLLRCGQHYHCWIENLQPECPGQHATAAGGPADGCPKLPPVGSWVEVHTVYSPRLAGGNCDPETLNCCAGEPVVVMGQHLKVTAGTTPGPVPVAWGPPWAEWSGSNTGPDIPPGSCKPISAHWSFALGCNSTVSLGQLGLFHHQDQARGLQPPVRLSKDLTHVVP
ncbi:MAG TPA: hypothetical protein VOA87_15700 [Thermoanaerobaculia bacterium]|nr:hypothetical protein [Thermoanaerobaculia bacterium]